LEEFFFYYNVFFPTVLSVPYRGRGSRRRCPSHKLKLALKKARALGALLRCLDRRLNKRLFFFSRWPLRDNFVFFFFSLLESFPDPFPSKTGLGKSRPSCVAFVFVFDFFFLRSIDRPPEEDPPSSPHDFSRMFFSLDQKRRCAPFHRKSERAPPFFFFWPRRIQPPVWPPKPDHRVKI